MIAPPTFPSTFPRLLLRLRQFSLVAGILVLCAGLLVLVGWMGNVAWLKLGLPTPEATFKANTALGFVLTSISLILWHWQPRSLQPTLQRQLPQLTALLALLLGALTLSQYLWGWDLGIDQLLAADPEAIHPGRMSVSSALVLLLTGVALLLLPQERPRSQRTAQVAALLAVLVAVQGMMGYAYGVRMFYEFTVHSNAVGLHAAVTGLLLSLGILAARPDRGPMQIFTSRSMGGFLVRRLLPVAVTLPLGLGWLTLELQQSGRLPPADAMSLLVLVLILSAGVFTWRTALAMDRVDRDRQRSTTRFRHLFDSSLLGIFFADANYRIVEANTRFLTDIGYDQTDLLMGRLYWDRLTPEEYWELDQQHAQELLQRGAIAPYEKEFWCRNGDRLPVLVGGTLIENPAEEPLALCFVVDMTERKQEEDRRHQAEQRLQAANERFELAAAAVSCVIYDWHVVRNHVTRTDGLLQVLGFSPQEAEPTCDWWRDRIHPDDLKSLPHHEQIRLEGMQGDRYSQEYRIRNKQGEYIYVADQGLVVRDGTGNPLRIVGSTTDITERKHVEESLRQSEQRYRALADERTALLERERSARAEAEAANRIKDEFLAVLSHELRSPLNPILGWAHLLQTRRYNETRTREALATIERNAKLQVQLIDDLLDIARILRGKLTLQRALVNLQTVILGALETVRMAAQAKAIAIQTDLDPAASRVSGDAARLQQVVWNLLSNAIKFTPQGGTIKVRLVCADSPPASFVRLTVQDTGKGIAPEFLPYVFDRFRQEDSGTTRKYGGLGLGLAIVRQIVELHGGTIGADSLGEGQGATFTVCLPMEGDEAGAKEENRGDGAERETNGEQRRAGGNGKNAGETAVAGADQPLAGIRILVVDDDADSRLYGAALLEQAGATVITAASAGAALQVLTTTPLDLLVSDIGMPGQDGYSLVRQLRSLPSATSQIPAIALTAYARDLDQQQAIAAGYQAHLAKPITPDHLIRTILGVAESRYER